MGYVCTLCERESMYATLGFGKFFLIQGHQGKITSLHFLIQDKLSLLTNLTMIVK